MTARGPAWDALLRALPESWVETTRAAYAAGIADERARGMVTLALEDPARFAAECDRLDGRYTRAARRARAILERLGER